MRHSQRDSDSISDNALLLASVNTCRKCADKMRIEQISQVPLAPELCTVTLICDRCGEYKIETVRNKVDAA
jgi:hypothetical protein